MRQFSCTKLAQPMSTGHSTQSAIKPPVNLRTPRYAGAFMLTALALVLLAPGAHAIVEGISGTGSATAASDAINGGPAGFITGGSWSSYAGNSEQPSAAVSDAAITSTFGNPGPTGRFLILSSGDATLATGSVTPSVVLPGTRNGGNSVTEFQIDLNVPSNCGGIAFDFQFLSEEFPLNARNYNDGFVAELDGSAWSFDAKTNTLTPGPTNIAHDGGSPIGADTASLTAASASGSTYAGATTKLTAKKSTSVGPHSLNVAIYNARDRFLDSAAFIGNLRPTDVLGNDCSDPSKITWLNENYCVSSAIDFVATAPAGKTLTSGSWRWGDGSSSTSWSSTSNVHHYSSPGRYSIRFDAQYSDGTGSSSNQHITIDTCPEPSIAYAPDPFCEGTNAAFTAAVEGYQIQSTRWSWDDGTSPTDSITDGAKHSFSPPSKYNLALAVTHTDGSSTSGTFEVLVRECDPPRITLSPRVFCVDTNIQFTAQAPTETSISSGTWYWGDGTSTAFVAAGQTRSYSEGMYRVQLDATYANGAVATSYVDLVVEPCPPPRLDLPDPPFCTHSNLAFGGFLKFPYKGTGTWEWGDGSTDSWSPGYIEHAYSEPGTYTVELTIDHTTGGVSTTSTTIEVPDCPKPTITWTPTTFCVGSDLTFTADMPTAYEPSSGTWSWGDGTPNTAWTPDDVTHAFATEGTFTVTLIMTYTDGGKAEGQVTVGVESCPAPIITVESEVYCVGSRVEFSGTARDPYVGQSGTWRWDDGSGATAWSTGTVTHPFSAPGTYYVSLELQHTDGSSATAVRAVNIPECPDANIISKTGSCIDETVQFIAKLPEGYVLESAQWAWGDSTPKTSGRVVTHQFTSLGTFAVSNTVAATDGATLSGSMDFSVVDCMQTWAAGDDINGKLYTVGDDIGCTPGSNSQRTGRVTVVHDVPAVRGADAPVDLMRAGGFGLADGRLVVAGGTHTCDFMPSQRTFIYIPQPPDTSLPVDYWVEVGYLGTPRISPASVGEDMYGNQALVFGGDTTGGAIGDLSVSHVPTASVEAFDPVNGWQGRSPMPAGLIGAAASRTDMDTVVVSGGFSHPQTVTSLVQEYDIQSDQWLGPHLDEYVSGHAGATCNSQRWLIGGATSGEGSGIPMHTPTGPGSTTVWSTGSGAGSTWFPSPLLNNPTIYAQATSLRLESTGEEHLFFQGGYSGGTVTNALYRIETTGGGCKGVPSGLTQLPGTATTGSPPRAEAALVGDTDRQLLYLFGGTSYSTQDRGGCPSDNVFAIDVNTGESVNLSLPGPTPGTPIRLPVATAAMGSAHLPDGRVLLAGGRVPGTNASGGATCYAPSDQVFVFSPIDGSLCAGPTLPKGIIGPAMTAVGWTVFIAGGDERGDVPATPSSSTDPWPFQPSQSMYSLDASTLPHCPGDSLPLLGGPSWVETDPLPLGVVHAEMLAIGSDVWVVGGNHHPNAAVRLVQQFTGSAQIAWQTDDMQRPRAFHNQENCGWGYPHLFSTVGGYSTGSLHNMTYNTFAVGQVSYEATGQTFEDPFAPIEVAFAISMPWEMATGTTPSSYRNGALPFAPC